MDGLWEAACAAAGRGWPVFPTQPGAKRPAIAEWERRASTDAGRIRCWWVRCPSANPAVATGPAGLVVVDLDDATRHGQAGCLPGALRHGAGVLARAAREAGTAVPATFAVRTPNNGVHLYFAAPAGVRLGNTQSRVGPLVDTRAHGGYVLAAGAVTSDGRYEVACEAPVRPLPDWLLHVLTPPTPVDTPVSVAQEHATAYVRAALAGEVRRVRDAVPGTRRLSLLRAAARMGRLPELDEAVITAALRAASDRHVAEGAYSLAERERAIADGVAWGRLHPRRISHFS